MAAAGGRIGEPAEGPRERVPAWTRWFVWLFLGAFVVCGVAGIEAWPLTGFRLFSHLRSEHQTAWRAYVVGPDGRERPVLFSRLGEAYRGFGLVMKTYPSLTPSARGRVCEAWTRAVARGSNPPELRVYRIDRDLTPRAGGHPAKPAVRTLRYECPGPSSRGGGGDAAS
jgi:hypothetical protein